MIFHSCAGTQLGGARILGGGSEYRVCVLGLDI